MSTRYIKKVFGSDPILEPNDTDNDAEIPLTAKSKSFNLFNVLNPCSEESEKEEETEQNTNNDCDEKIAKHKKNKKKRKSNKNHHPNENIANNGIDEIDKTINEVNKLLGEPLPCSSTENADNLVCVAKLTKESILEVQHKHLNPYNELKKIFGSKTVQADQTKRRGRNPRHLKKTCLVSPRDNWPSVGKSGLSMSFETNGNYRYFVYEPNSAYKQVQQRFLDAVATMNLDDIISIINIHPYHVDSLLQLGDLFKLQEDLAMSAELTERALYCLENAFHPMFNVTTAQCRLDYKKQQNRALFFALFKHLHFIGGRACYRTSLEFCKLLLSLDPEGDPLAMVLCIDFFALRAREDNWLIEFCNLWENSRNLTQLPNIAYSLALAHFHLGHQAKADELLQNALIMFPGVLFPLLDKCTIQPDPKVVSHDFFSKALNDTPCALKNLQKLYIVRNYHLWKEANVLPWLEKQVHAVLNRVDSNDEYIKYCELKRRQRYRGNLPRNILRHIILLDMKEVSISAHEIQNEDGILSYDPLPPADSIDIYRPVPNDRIIRNSSNFFSLFFSTLFTDIDGDNAAAALNGLNLFNDNDENA